MDTLPAPEELEPLLSAALALPALKPHTARLERLRRDYARGLEQKDAPLAVALVGATGAGKSTLLNALAGQALAREGEDRPTSSAATLFAPEGAGLEPAHALADRGIGQVETLSSSGEAAEVGGGDEGLDPFEPF